MSRPGGPGWDREAWWAINCVDRRRNRNVVYPYRFRTSLVVAGTPQLPYGRSTHTSAYLTHLAGRILIVWRRGVIIGAFVCWRCGSRTNHFRLLAEPDSNVCPACLIQRPPGRTR